VHPGGVLVPALAGPLATDAMPRALVRCDSGAINYWVRRTPRPPNYRYKGGK